MPEKDSHFKYQKFEIDIDKRLNQIWNSLWITVLTYLFMVSVNSGWFFENGMSISGTIVATSISLMCGYIILA